MCAHLRLRMYRGYARCQPVKTRQALSLLLRSQMLYRYKSLGKSHPASKAFFFLCVFVGYLFLFIPSLPSSSPFPNIPKREGLSDTGILSLDLDALLDTVGLARVDLLARLGDGGEHLVVRERRVGDDGRRLALERDVVALDTYTHHEITGQP